MSGGTTGSGTVRIIGGQWKRSKLAVANKPGLRPTSDRVRETLFNWLGQDLTGLRCLDAFAGSGALGFEAASRGAAEVLLLEQDSTLVTGLRANAERLKADRLQVRRGDALALMKSLPTQGWDVVFLDPPFLEGRNEGVFVQALQLARPLLSLHGQLYLEAPRPWADGELSALGWRCMRRGKAGAVHYHLLERDDAPTGNA